jgi:hypothetical protein
VDRLIAIVLLRWRTELRFFARARARLAGLLLLLPGLVLSALLGFALFYFGVKMLNATHPTLVLPLLSAVATGIGLLWALSPLVAGVAFTETHDVSGLLHFPVPMLTLAAGSLIANLLQPMVLLKIPVLLAVALGVSTRPSFLPLALLGVTLTFVFMLAASQTAGLVLHALARNRRLQDAALFLGLGLGFVLSVAPIVVMAGGGRVMDSATRFLMASNTFALSPFAWGVRAAVHAGRGELVPFGANAALAVLGIALAMAASVALMDRIHRGELDLGGSSGAEAARAQMLFETPLGTLVEKDLRAAWRDPALKATLLMGLVTPLLFLFMLTRGPGEGSGTSVLMLASLVGLGTYGANAFGLERRGIVLLLSFPIPRWRILVAKNLAAILFRIPGLVTLLLAGTLLAPLAMLPAMIVIALATFLASCGVDNYMAVLFPVPAPAAGRSPYSGGAAGGRGLGAAVLGTLLMLGALAVSAPFALLAWLPVWFRAPWLWLFSLPLALAGAASVYAMLVAGAAGMLERREPELLQRILEEE